MKNDNRECRSFHLIERAKTDEPEYIAEGYASTFEPYLLFRDGDTEFYEQIDKDAFNDADFTDCVFRVDHTGPVYARTSAGTVKCDIDEHGLHTLTDLSKTQRGRELFEDIMAGNYPQMSFCFLIEEETYNNDTKTRTINKISKVFDISPVTWPANPTTELSARSTDFFNGVIEKERAERLMEERKQKALARIKELMEG